MMVEPSIVPDRKLVAWTGKTALAAQLNVEGEKEFEQAYGDF